MAKLETQNNDTLNTTLITTENDRLILAGNVSFESIEQVGHMTEPDFKYEIAFDKVPYLSDTIIIALGVPDTNGVSTNMEVQNMAGPFAPLSDGQLAIETSMISPDIYDIRVGWKPLGGTQKFCIFNAGDKNKYFRFNSPQISKPEYISVRGKEFKPFFTEEQYQALLGLIS